MDSDTLQTASTYLNNLLLARGLLRDSKSLDFAKPTRETRAQIINLVHDLLLRRDRDQENREQIALTLRTLRTDQTRRDGEVDKLQLRLDEKERSLLQAQTEARNSRIEMRKLESATKALQDQLARLKVSMNQIKTQCANDVRKRDMHIERLKSHMQGQQRGNKGGLVAPTISATGRSGHSFNASVRELQDPEYNLKQETTEFLTQLSSGLSDENDALIEMIRGTLSTLKELLGVPEQGYDSTVGSIEDEEGGFAHGSLAEELESMIQMLRTVLTNPNFVSMDEVEARDEEIARLREAWDKMECRWRELLVMMNGWRTRMEKSGDTINLDDLRRGLGLGVDLEPPPTAQQARRHTRADSDADSGFRDLSPTPSQEQPPPSTVKTSRSINPPEFFSVKPARHRTLSRMSPNVQSPRKVAFADEASENNDPVETSCKLDAPAIVKSSVKNSTTSSNRCPIRPQSFEPHDAYRSHVRDSSPPPQPVDTPSKESLQQEDNEEPRMTVEEKLRLAQAEAEAAAAHALTKQSEDDSQIDLEISEEVSKLRSSPVRKTRIQGRPKRRKSTLSPEELENLLGFE